MDTIFALATAKGRAGVAVIRISGQMAFGALSHFGARVPQPRRAGVRQLQSSDGMMLDEALVLCFKGPSSFTGEDIVELHVHGGPAIIDGVMAELSLIEGFRLAEPGEFTRRALLNGKLDLSQVEGLADLIDAETEAQRRQAQRLFSGAMGEKVETWRKMLLRAAMLLEATIDFADEEVPEDVTGEVQEIVCQLIDLFQQEISGSKTAERLRSGFEVAIIGPPNVGKSTLLNAISGRDAAITSSIAGTTRDVVEVRLDLDGIPVTFLDTAGLHDSVDEVEKIGMERARLRAAQADICVILSDDEKDFVDIPEGKSVWLKPKGDLRTEMSGSVSGKTGAGVDDLLNGIKEHLETRVSSVGLVSRRRQADVLQMAVQRLSGVRALLRSGESSFDLVAEEIRICIRSIEVLIGRIGVEDVLDEVFSNFCLGK